LNLAAGALLRNKEDIFCPGIFHTGNDEEAFKINKPILFFQKTAPSTSEEFSITATRENGWQIRVPNFDKTVALETTTANVLRTMPIGSTYQMYFEYASLDNSDRANQLSLYDSFVKQWAMPFRVKEIVDDGTHTILKINSSLKDYVGELTSASIHNRSFGVFPNSSTVAFELAYVNGEDAFTPTEQCLVQVTTNTVGTVESYEFLSGGKGYTNGMVLKATGSYASASDRWYVTKVDNTSGWQLPASRNQTLNNTDLEISSNDVNMFLIPVLNYSNGDLTTDVMGDQIGFRKIEDADGRLFPITINNNYLHADTTIYPDEGLTNKLSNGLFRKSGLLDPTDAYFDPLRSNLINHDSDSLLHIASHNKSITDESSITFGPNSVSDTVISFATSGNPNNIWTFDTSDQTHKLRINYTNWDTNHPNVRLPTFTQCSFISNSREIHLELGGVINYDTVNTLIDIQVLAYDVQNTDFTYKRVDGAFSGLIPDGFVGPSFDNELNFDYAGGFNSLRMVYADVKENNNQISCRWQQLKGSVALTGENNYFGDNDPTKLSRITDNTTIAMRSSYNQGGFYFLSHFTGLLNNSEESNVAPRTFEAKQNNFNMGYDFWNIASLPSNMYTWRSDYKAPDDLNFNQSITDITNLWDYYPVYREKTFIIDKTYAVPSDISASWVRQGHELEGALNPITGGSYVPRTESGILQNQFMMPVYGANNRINPDGTYEIDNDLYPNSGGLDPAHCIGKNYLQSDSTWLAGSLKYQCPNETIGSLRKTYYNVFFRTAWTFVRGYDPLAKDSGGNPDRTSLVTVNITGDKLGNATKTALNGDTIGPGTASQSYFELGQAAGLASGDVRFGQESFYPIYYLDETRKADYPKALISQFVGAPNITLEFDSAVSSFGFQFLHNAFTAPLVDNTGGQNAIKVFYGDRKSKVLNHECFSGVVVVNYARPSYTFDVFSKEEVDANETFGEYFPYGIDPFRATGSVGRSFLQKLGFTDKDLGINSLTGNIDTENTKLNYVLTDWSENITDSMDGDTGARTFIVNSYDTFYYGTTGSDIDVSDAVISTVPDPVESAGLETNNETIVPNVGKSRKTIVKYGDFIFYPYSLDETTNSFQDKAIVRFDNASSTYGNVGGLRLSNASRSCGLPLTTGSTSLVDDSTIPRQLNPDCNLYLAYTIACGSSAKQASLLPQKLENAYMIVLSSLMKEANLYMPKAGFVNGMSIANKVFITGDYVLSQGLLSFYAKEDFVLSQIETTIRDTSYQPPSTLGKNSSVIYQITNFNPTPEKKLATIEEMQEVDLQIMETINEHVAYLNGNADDSKLNSLTRDLYTLGIDILSEQGSDVVNAVRNQINYYDLPNLTQRERIEFLQSPAGKTFVRNAGDLKIIEQQTSRLADIQNDLSAGGISLGQARKSTRDSNRQIRESHGNILQRTPQEFFAPYQLNIAPNAGDLMDDMFKVEPAKQLRSLVYGELRNSSFATTKEREEAEAKIRDFRNRMSQLTSGRRGRPTTEMLRQREDIRNEMNDYIDGLTRVERTSNTDSGTPAEIRARAEGQRAIAQAGYSEEDIRRMEEFAAQQRKMESIPKMPDLE
jgi:hypothetical protein